MLAARPAPDGDAGIVFPAPLARGLRDPANVSGDLRELLDGFECEVRGTGCRLGPAVSGPAADPLR